MEVKIRSWRTHVRQHHYPSRKDCQICQETAARGSPHLPPKAAVLSLDIAGPLVETEDVNRKKAKFVLVGTFTWPTGGLGEDVEEEVGNEEEIEEEREERGAVLQLEDEAEDERVEKEEEAEVDLRAMRRSEDEEEAEEKDEEEAAEKGAEEEKDGEERKDAQIQVHRMAMTIEA